MIRSFLFFLLIIISNNHIWAQDLDAKLKEKITYRIYYHHEHVRDTSKRDKVYKENMVLLAGENYSQFLSYDKILEHNSVQDIVTSELKTGNTNVKIPAGKIIIPDEIILSYYSNKAMITTYLVAHFHYLKVLPEINWELKDSVKTIEGVTCHSATTHYLGRDWNVWYNPDIAIPAGPWFLKGLPGLIMEAEDYSKQVKYTFIRLESANTESEVFKKRGAYQQIGLLDFDNYQSNLITEAEKNSLLDLARKDFKTFRMQQIENGGTAMFVEYGITNYYSWLKEIPNPIDLTSK